MNKKRLKSVKRTSCTFQKCTFRVKDFPRVKCRKEQNDFSIRFRQNEFEIHMPEVVCLLLSLWTASNRFIIFSLETKKPSSLSFTRDFITTYLMYREISTSAKGGDYRLRYIYLFQIQSHSTFWLVLQINNEPALLTKEEVNETFVHVCKNHVMSSLPFFLRLT